ncbi:helix-turn-helix transcriptional regulator [Breznakiella homolactica]|uniref:Helix-turn-helix domain-containing protein n=1 Tax=Breznakiella homolactica TaxID=2798577 RepID=A0A7T8BAL2_9SPIR|nr:AraC family transcriptional regulator [Breznakiella homolactica]QQO09617.1 AraC family transcriptional regulator [Breznakiella homolactica]
MRIVREYNRIPQSCVERFIPSRMLTDTVFSKMGILNGGISTFHEGSYIKRPTKRAYHILIFTISGKGSFTMEDDTTVVTSLPDIFFSHADGQGHIHLPHTTPWTILWFQISRECAWLVPPFDDWGILTASTPEHAVRLHTIQESILSEELSTHDEGRRVQELYAELFMIYLKRELRMQQNHALGRHQVQMNRLWKAVATSLDKPWDLRDMSDFTGISRAHLSRLCMVFYGKPPGEKVREIKMEHARSLLRHFNCQVSEVSELIGYENTSSFSAAYKKHFGYSPKQETLLAGKAAWLIPESGVLPG